MRRRQVKESDRVRFYCVRQTGLVVSWKQLVLFAEAVSGKVLVQRQVMETKRVKDLKLSAYTVHALNAQDKC